MEKLLSVLRQRIICNLRCKLTLALMTLCFVVLSLASGLDIYFNVRSQRMLMTAEQLLAARAGAFEVEDFVIDRL
ncbi:MAG TPA: hypothetical protein PLL10_11655, partial [Elusimicrobiales bacterium]|nr:hypothetical protein [Elusimicrobiales bacterium]